MYELTEEQKQIVSMIRDWVNKDVIPAANQMDVRHEYPHHLVEQMKELGLFGATIPEKYGGMGLDYLTYALIVMEICRGWMSVSGVLNTHLIGAFIINNYGTEEQKQRFLPAMARGEKRGALCLTETHAGSDVQAIKTTATKDGDSYIVNGTKMFVTNGRYGNLYTTIVKTDPKADPPYKGMSCFIIDKDGGGITVSREIDKLGYRGTDTVEVVFDNCQVPAANLVGEKEGQGFFQVMSGLEVGRVNIAARAVGVATAAFEAAIKYSQERYAFGKPICEHQAIQIKLADMATKVEAARLLTLQAAIAKNKGERADLEAGMAKLFASEICYEVAMESMRVHGGYGFTTEFPVERYYRDAPLMIIGEGTNEIQKQVIARNLLKKYKI